MTIEAATLYRDGRRVGDFALGSGASVRRRRSDFIWVEIQDPTADELERLKARFDLHPLTIDGASDRQQSPRIDVFGDRLFIVAHTARYDGDLIDYGQISIFAGRGYVIVARHGSAASLARVRARIAEPSNLLKLDAGHVLHAVLDFVIESYQPMIDQIGEQVLALEERVLVKPLDQAEVTRIFRLRRELARFQREFGPISDVLGKLANFELPCIARDARPYFKDVQDAAQRTDLTVGGLRDVITSVFDLSSLLEQRRQGEISRRLAAWAAVVAVPTAITGVYGMNFDHMPELHWRYGYPATLGLVAAVCLLLVWRFRRAGWL